MTALIRRLPADFVPSAVGWAAWLGLLAVGVCAGALRGVDVWCGEWMASLRTPALDHAMRGMTFFGSSAFTLAALLGLALVRWRQAGRGAAVRLGGAFAVGVGLEVGLRLAVAQWRPDLLILPAADVSWVSRFKLAGFPSGHAYRSAFVWGCVARQFPAGRSGAIGRVACLLLILLVGMTRVYLNRHWASDVMGGWLVALVALELVSARHVKCRMLIDVMKPCASRSRIRYPAAGITTAAERRKEAHGFITSMRECCTSMLGKRRGTPRRNVERQAEPRDHVAPLPGSPPGATFHH